MLGKILASIPLRKIITLKTIYFNNNNIKNAHKIIEYGKRKHNTFRIRYSKLINIINYY